MLLSILPVPFADAARQRQYEAVRAALDAVAAAPATVLLGNLGAFAGVEADALLVRPNCLALLVLTPRAGRLTMPTLAYGSWQLNKQPLPGRDGADNPFAQYRQQQPAALAWLSEQLGQSATALPPCLGLALFEAPLTFGPEVEAHLHQYAAVDDFQLLGSAAQLPARLGQLPRTNQRALTEPALLAWANQLLAELEATQDPADLPAENYLEQKLRQLWRWLGAEDIPADPPYGGPALPPSYARDEHEQARLQHLRQELQAELHQQRQEAATREKAHVRDLAQLRQQLAQAGQSAAERQAEQQAKAALEASLRAARAELTARNHELDARIQQLGQLIKQLQNSAATSQMLPAAPVRQSVPGVRRQPSYRRLRQAERWGLVGLALAILGVGSWNIARLVHPAQHRLLTTALRPATASYLPAENPAPVISYDTLTPEASPARPDTVAAPAPEATTPAADDTPEPTPLATPLHVDSATLRMQPGQELTPADSASSDSPTP